MGHGWLAVVGLPFSTRKWNATTNQKGREGGRWEGERDRKRVWLLLCNFLFFHLKPQTAESNQSQLKVWWYFLYVFLKAENYPCIFFSSNPIACQIDHLLNSLEKKRKIAFGLLQILLLLWSVINLNPHQLLFFFFGVAAGSSVFLLNMWFNFRERFKFCRWSLILRQCGFLGFVFLLKKTVSFSWKFR